jgi:hypothetical protein
VGQPDAWVAPGTSDATVKRVLLAVALVWAVTLVFPGLRDRLDPKVESTRAWAGDRLEGPFTPVRNRYRHAQVTSQLDKVQRALVMTRNQGGRPPAQEELGRFMRLHEVTPDGVDPWGTPYLIVQEPDSVAVISAGPDRKYYTSDDLVRRVRFTEIRRRPPGRR